MKKIAIGRVSTKEQNEQRQVEAFLKEGVEERYIFVDKCTGNGGHLEDRKEYQLAKRFVEKGDVVYLDALDRLGRNTKEIEQEWRFFTEEVGAYMVVLNMPILDTRPKEGMTGVEELVAKIVLNVFSWMAQQETEERKRRQREGIELAKKRGAYKGRKPVTVNPYEFEQVLNEVRSGERTNKWAVEKLGLTRATYYNLIKEFDTKTGRFEEV